MSETLRLSEAQLPEAEREAWRKLGVFTASFDAWAAEAIAGADEKMLGHFVSRGLLEREGADRFKLPDLAADYARAQLTDAALTDLHLGHAGHYTLVGYKSQCLLEKDDTVAAVALFDRERAQIEAAFTWLDGRADEAAVRQMCHLVSGVRFISKLCFDLAQWNAWQERQHRADRILRDYHTDLRDAIFGGVRQEMAFWEQRLVIARETGWRGGEIVALMNIGNIHSTLGDTRKAIEYYEQAQVAGCEMDVRRKGLTLVRLGSAHADLGDARKAIEYHEQALSISREIGDRFSEDLALSSLAHVYAKFGEPRRAVEFYEQALVFAREIGDRHGEAGILLGAALQLEKLGEREQALARAELAAEIFTALKSPKAEQARQLADRLRGEA